MGRGWASGLCWAALHSRVVVARVCFGLMTVVLWRECGIGYRYKRMEGVSVCTGFGKREHECVIGIMPSIYTPEITAFMFLI